MHFTYILECADKTLYTGYTTDLERRIQEHNSAKLGAKYTKTRQPVTLAYAEKFDTKSEALKREYELKTWPRKKKLELLGSNDTRKFLRQ